MNNPINERIKLQLHRLYNSEHFDVCKAHIIEPLTTPILAVPALSSPFQLMQSILLRIDDLYKDSLAAPQTKEIESLHTYRRSLFVLFKQIVLTAGNSTEAQEVADAAALVPLLNTYKEIPTATYVQQSGLVDNFTRDCNKPAYQPAVASLGLTPLIARTVTVNNRFQTLSEERDLDKQYVIAKGKLADARLEMDSAIELLIASVNNAYKLNELGAKDPALRANLEPIITILNAALYRIKHILADRGHHSSSHPQTPDTTNPPAPNTPPQNPNANPPAVNPDDLNPPAVGEH